MLILPKISGFVNPRLQTRLVLLIDELLLIFCFSILFKLKKLQSTWLHPSLSVKAGMFFICHNTLQNTLLPLNYMLYIIFSSF